MKKLFGMRAVRIGLALLVAGLLVTVFVRRSALARERAAFHDYVAELGIELKDWVPPSVPEAENAFPLLQSIADEFDEAGLWNPSWNWRIDSHKVPPENEWPAIETWVESAAPFMARFRTASRLPRSVDVNQPAKVVEHEYRALDHMGTASDIARWMCRVAEHKQQPAGPCVEAVETVLRVAVQVEPGPMLVEVLRSRNAAGVCDELPRIVRLPGYDAADARRRLDPLIEEIIRPQRFLDGIEFELVYPVAVMRDYEEEQRSLGMRSWRWLWELWGGPLAYRETREYLQLNEESRARIREVGLYRFTEESAHLWDGEAENSLLAPLVAMAAGRLADVAQLRLARVFLALHVHQQKHGEFPATLTELAPLFPDGLPLDPYTGENFHYEPGVRIDTGHPEPRFGADLGFPLR